MTEEPYDKSLQMTSKFARMHAMKDSMVREYHEERNSPSPAYGNNEELKRSDLYSKEHTSNDERISA